MSSSENWWDFKCFVSLSFLLTVSMCARAHVLNKQQFHTWKTRALSSLVIISVTSRRSIILRRSMCASLSIRLMSINDVKDGKGKWDRMFFICTFFDRHSMIGRREIVSCYSTRILGYSSEDSRKLCQPRLLSDIRPDQFVNLEHFTETMASSLHYFSLSLFSVQIDRYAKEWRQ